MIRPTRRHVLAGAGMTLLTAGCSAITGTSAPKLYVLQPRIADLPGLPAVKWQLVIAVPETPEALNTQRIALYPTASRLDYFADASWADRMPAMIQAALIEAFETTGKAASVGRDTADLRADYLLQVEIRDFAAHYDSGDNQPPQAVMRLESKLIHMPERQIIGSLASTEQVRAARNDLDSIVEAFDAVSGACLGRIVDWSLRTPAA